MDSFLTTNRVFLGKTYGIYEVVDSKEVREVERESNNIDGQLQDADRRDEKSAARISSDCLDVELKSDFLGQKFITP